MKNWILVLGFMALVGTGLFWEDVYAIFAGMTAMQALDVIVTFLLKVGALSVISFVVYNLPHAIKPWLRTFRWRQRQARRGGRYVNERLLRSARNDTRIPKALKDRGLMIQQPDDDKHIDLKF